MAVGIVEPAMGKKAPKKGKHSSQIRYGDVRPPAIKEGVSRMRELAQALEECAGEMESQGIKSVWLDGVTKMDRGLKLLAEFAGSVEMAIVKKKYEA